MGRRSPGSVAEPLLEGVVHGLHRLGVEVATGVFGAMMAVDLVNDGAVHPARRDLTDPRRPGSRIGAMNAFGTVLTLQQLIALLLGVAVLGLNVFALVDALRHQPPAYVAAGKRTKGLWSAVLVVSTLVAFLSVFNPLSLFGILAVVAAAYYLTDVRPALRQISGRGGGRGSTMGPYGPW